MSQIQEEISNQNIIKEFEVVKDGKHYQYVLEANVDEYYVYYMKLLRRWYPNTSYGNYVSDVLEVTSHGTMIEFKAYRVRINWDGSGRDECGWIAIDATVLQETPEFLYRDTIEQIMSAEDFEELVENIIKFIENYAMNFFAL